MPSNFMFADNSFPQIQEGENPQVSVRKLQNYLFLLLEQLRYILQNLEPSNFNETELRQYLQGNDAVKETVKETMITDGICTDELYADYGEIADLTVDKLRTDYKRARKYLAGDMSQLDYLYIHDETISFITGTTDGTRIRQMQVDGRLFWWRDETKTRMTSLTDTGLPVMTYVYDELVKAQFRFQNITLKDGTQTVMPVMVWGAGFDQYQLQGKCLFYKATDGMRLEYYKSDGGMSSLELGEQGAFVGAVTGGIRNIVEVEEESAEAVLSGTTYPIGTVLAVLEAVE